MAIGKKNTPAQETTTKVKPEAATETAAVAAAPAAVKAPKTADARARKIVYIDLSTVIAGEAPRRKIDAAAFDRSVIELGKSIAAIGLQSPLIASPVDGQTPTVYTLRAGFGRHAAISALAAEKPKLFKQIFPEGIPVLLASADESAALVDSLTENFVRTKADVREIFTRLVAARDAGVEFEAKAIAACTGLKASNIADLIAIADEAIPAVREAFMQGIITFETAAVLARKPHADQEKEMNPESVGDEETTVTEAPTNEAAAAKPSKPSKKEVDGVGETLSDRIHRYLTDGTDESKTLAVAAVAAAMTIDFMRGTVNAKGKAVMTSDGLLTKLDNLAQLQAFAGRVSKGRAGSAAPAETEAKPSSVKKPGVKKPGAAKS